MLFHASPQFVRMLDLEREREAAHQRLAAEARRTHNAQPSLGSRTLRAVTDRILGMVAAPRAAEPAPTCATCPAAS